MGGSTEKYCQEEKENYENQFLNTEIFLKIR